MIQTATPESPPPEKRDRLLRLKAVEDKVGLGSSSIYRKMAAGTFPRPKEVEGGGVRWRESDIDKWIDALPDAGKIPPK